MEGKSFEVNVNPEIIKWARESGGWSIEEISKKLKISIENYKKLESGEKKPTFRQIELLSYYLKRPLSTFFLSEPPDEPNITTSFRIFPGNDNLSKDLRLAIRKASYYQSILNELMINLGEKTNPNTPIFTINDDPINIAIRERKRFGISLEKQFKWKNAYEAFNSWRKSIENMNIFVFQFNFPIEDARGFSLMNNEPFIIAINSNDNILSRIFTLFHEYAHIILRIPEIYLEDISTNKEIEYWCNNFASEFLVPYEDLKKEEEFIKYNKSKKLDYSILFNLSKRFKVSKKLILTKLKNLNLIDQKDYEMEIFKLEMQLETKNGGFLTPYKKCLQEKGEKFISLVLEAREKGIINTHDTIEYLSIKFKYLDKVQNLIARF